MSAYLAQVTVGGVTVSVPYEDHQWEIVAGYVAPIQAWVMPAEMCSSILEAVSGLSGADREATLTLGNPNNPLTVERVYVVGSAPASDPRKMHILLADVRWYFARAWMVYDLNVRRRIGDKRLVGDSLIDSTVVDSVAYLSWTTNNGKAYKWDAAKDQVLTYLTTARNGRPPLSYVTDDFSIPITAQAIQETVVDSSGTSGLARAIESVPGAGIYVDLKGTIHVYDATPGAETDLVKALPPTLNGHGDLQLIDNSGIRPLLWRVYLDYAVEVRCDFKHNYDSSDDALLKALFITELDNVLQVTDAKLDIPAGTWGPARTVGQGTWITMDEAYAAWGPRVFAGAPALNLPQLSDSIVANHWFGDALQQYCVGGANYDQDNLWTSRIQELMRCYRTYFRINVGFADQIRHVWAVRSAVWDTTTGTRAPSPVYCNYHFEQIDDFVSAKITAFGQNVTDSMPRDGSLATAKPTGFRLNIEDDELMIVSIYRDQTKYPDHTRLAPSPTIDIPTVPGLVGFNESVHQTLVPTDSWSLATVLTCSPASPNDWRRLYEVQVTAADAAATAGIGSVIGYAPDQELRSHLADARIPWRDSTAASTMAIFGHAPTGGGGQVVGVGAGAIFVDVISSQATPITTLTPVNRESELLPLAKAIAAADLMSRLDRYEGSKAVPMDGTLVPIGSINRVGHRVTANRAVTILHADGAGPSFSPLDFLPSAARTFLLKEIQAGRVST